jgi:excisionase family DNA binding protein
MYGLATIPHTGRTRPGAAGVLDRARIPRRLPRRARAAYAHDGQGAFTQLIDARAAARLLGVPHTWVLAQARAGRIPHHRLGHYVRFDVEDLTRWLAETRCGAAAV